MSRVLPALLALAALAGCLAPGAPVEPASLPHDPGELPHLDLSDAHDHRDRAAHNVSWNLEMTGHHPIAPDVTKIGRANQVVTRGGYAYVSLYNLANGSAPGLAILDVRGPAPILVGTLETPDMTPIDVFPSPDGKAVFLAGHRDNRAQLPAAAQTCSGTPMVNVCTPFVPSGVIMVDVSDPAKPRVAATHASAPSGAHTVKAASIGGETYVLVASYGFATASRLASGVEILRVDETAAGTRMVPVSRFLAQRASGQEGDASVFVHDLWVEEHPLLKKPLLYVAYWDGGVVVADLSDPAQPTELSDWAEFDAAHFGNVHFVRPVGVLGGRHVTLATPEFPQSEHSGEAYVLDTTDPTRPKLLGKWRMPGGDALPNEGYRFSPHNFDPEPNGTRVVYGHYHSGIWLLDLADPTNATVQGYAYPVAPGDFTPNGDAPSVWNAVWTEDGRIVVSDGYQGLFTYRVVSDAPGEAPYLHHLG